MAKVFGIITMAVDQYPAAEPGQCLQFVAGAFPQSLRISQLGQGFGFQAPVSAQHGGGGIEHPGGRSEPPDQGKKGGGADAVDHAQADPVSKLIGVR